MVLATLLRRSKSYPTFAEYHDMLQALDEKLSFFCGFCNEMRVVFLTIFGSKSRPTKIYYGSILSLWNIYK
ncbi:hypothetical protein CUMW_126630 [Citrus unshiu]|uniref:Uncharacterized protein n=1 Tax=Citrus unshiu TaxID=55188 RepID=A0A2H5PDI7_CITUN|nr:hypothetical protein CUMW_126630 [Citrus unshiu]